MTSRTDLPEEIRGRFPEAMWPSELRSQRVKWKLLGYRVTDTEINDQGRLSALLLVDTMRRVGVRDVVVVVANDWTVTYAIDGAALKWRIHRVEQGINGSPTIRMVLDGLRKRPVA